MKPVVFENFDVKTDLKNNLNEIYEILATSGLVLFKNQHLTVQDQEAILRENFSLNKEHEIMFQSDFFKDFLVEDSKFLVRVTGQKNKNNKPGIFADPNGLVWHSDNPTTELERNLTWLYGYEGSNGSITEYCNTDLAFQNMSAEMQALAKNLVGSAFSGFADKEPQEYLFPLYSNSGYNRYSWSFPFKQIKKFEGYSIEETKEIIELLTKEVLKEEYCYKHTWEDKDLIISNEKVTIHKRLPFDRMEERVLHKGAMGFHIVNK